MRSNAHSYRNDTGAVVAAELHPADEGDTTTLPKTLAAAEANLEALEANNAYLAPSRSTGTFSLFATLNI